VASLLAERARPASSYSSQDEEEEEDAEEGEEQEVPSITLTIINIHPAHVADARFYLRHEVQTAEAAGANIVLKVSVLKLKFHYGDFHRNFLAGKIANTSHENRTKWYPKSKDIAALPTKCKQFYSVKHWKQTKKNCTNIFDNLMNILAT